MEVEEKTSKLHVLAAMIETEIYYFRTKTAHYSAAMRTQDMKRDIDDEDDRQHEDAPALTSHRMRAKFIETVQGIFKHALSDSMSHDALHSASGTFPDKGSVAVYARECVLHNENVPERKTLPRQETLKHSAISDVENHLCEKLLPKDGKDMDDFLSPVSTEAYVEERLSLKLAHWRSSAPAIAGALGFMNTLIVVMSTVGTLLAALGWKEWVPVSMALGSVLTSWVEYKGLRPR